MFKFLLVIALLGGAVYFANEEFDLWDNRDVPTGPSVNYPGVDGGGAVKGVGDGTKGVLGG